MRRRPALLAVLALLLGAPAARAGEPVRVLYAGSLVAMMEHAIGPAFDRASGDTFQGFFGGSKELANQIKGKLRRADVFVSSSPDGERAADGRRQWRLGALVRGIRAVAGGDRLRPAQPLRARLADQALVAGARRTRLPPRPH